MTRTPAYPDRQNLLLLFSSFPICLRMTLVGVEEGGGPTLPSPSSLPSSLCVSTLVAERYKAIILSVTMATDRPSPSPYVCVYLVLNIR